MAKVKIKLKQTDTADEATLEANGSPEWIKEIIPLIAYVVGAIVKSRGIEPGNIARAGNELNEAFYAATRGEEYNGEIVTVTIEDQG